MSRRAAAIDAAVVVVIAGVASLMRAPALAPSSLWLDDAWVAMASRAEGLDSLLVVPTAKGFAALLGAWFDVSGFSELRAQLLPFAFGVAGPAALYLVAVRVCRLPRAAALLAAAVLAAAPMHVEYSTRVKQFSLDALLTVAVLALGWRVVERPGNPRRWWQLAGGGLAAVILSAAAAPVVAAAVVAGVLAGGARAGWKPAATFVAGAGLFWLVVLRDAVTGDLRRYWEHAYVPLGAGWAGDVVGALADLLDGFSPLPVPLTAIALVAAAVVLAARRPHVAAFLILPLVAAVALATVELSPLGGGRTDIWLYPALALGVAVAARPLPAPLLAAAALAVVVLAPSAGPYPVEDVRPLIEEMEAARRPGDAVLLYPAARFAYALYTPAPVSLHESGEASGFSSVVHDRAVHVIDRNTVTDGTGDAERVWLLATHWRSDLADIRLVLHEDGWASVETRRRPGAWLELWERQ